MVKIVKHSDKEDRVLINMSTTGAWCPTCNRKTTSEELKQHYGQCAKCETQEDQENNQ